MTVNQFCIAFLIVFFTIGCSQEKQSSEEVNEALEVLVGTYTDKGSKGIYGLKFNPATGSISDGTLLVESSNPSYLAMSQNRLFVYAVNEDEEGGVSSFKWNAEHTELQPISQLPTKGIHPCYIDLNMSGDIMAVANYSSGSVTAFNLRQDGSIETRPQVIQHSGSGPNKERQERPHAHCSIFNTERWLYVVDLGIDQIIAYPVGEGALGDPHVALQLEPGDGPRHLIFHPIEQMAFVINELSNTVVSLKVDSINGQLNLIDRVSTLPDNFTETSYCADIHISNDGKFIYASNRGHESIAIISVSQQGNLNWIATESVRGEWPRNFTLTPDGNYLLVANQFTSNIVVFEVDKESGLLNYSGNQTEISSPVFLSF